MCSEETSPLIVHPQNKMFYMDREVWVQESGPWYRRTYEVRYGRRGGASKLRGVAKSRKQAIKLLVIAANNPPSPLLP